MKIIIKGIVIGVLIEFFASLLFLYSGLKWIWEENLFTSIGIILHYPGLILSAKLGLNDINGFFVTIGISLIIWSIFGMIIVYFVQKRKKH